ncbi:E3 ubiquitin-protein ligase MARCHF5 [Chelonia mydas]|uniref:E3 ubiquitin-protein ligase MARCHF5 n=2 Tax=Cheloniidae TaxID=8465 RepID=UPI001CA942E5|nr:E3 ubiquitin-protein ligase MARCHF5 [Chelonia mydas]
MVRRSPSFPSALTRGGGGSLALTSQRCHSPFRLLSPRSVWSLRPAPDRSHPGPVLRLAACPAPCLRREEAPVSPALVSGFGPGIRPTPPDTAAAAGPPGSPHPENMSDQAGSALQQTMDRSCWVCFATDEDDRTAEWVRPCRCRGSTKWVHQTCLQRWVDEKQRGNSTARVACPQCNAEYLIVFPKLGPVVYVLDLADRLISKACPFAAAGIMVGSIYWTAVTYGAVTVMQVVGHKEGLDVMERADPLFLLIGLPTIPVMLILGKMIRWEDYVLRLWRKYSNKLQILNSIFPGIGCPVPRIPAEANPLADHVSATRILCGALVFPTIATIVGKLMFSSVNSNLQRTILGGIAFVAIKGAFKVYFKQQQYLRQAHRKILNYPEQEGA